MTESDSNQKIVSNENNVEYLLMQQRIKALEDKVDEEKEKFRRNENSSFQMKMNIVLIILFFIFAFNMTHSK